MRRARYSAPMKSQLLVLSLSGLIATLSACGKHDEPSHFEVGQREYKEALLPLIEKFEKAEHLGPCDRKLLPKMKEMAIALDARKEQIDAYAQSLPLSDKYRRVKVGPLVVRELKVPPVPREGWQSDRYGWNEYIRNYEEALKQGDNSDWAFLNRVIRGIIVNDEDRIVYGMAYNLDHDFPGELRRIRGIVQTCAQRPDCKTVEMTSAEFAWLRARTDYPDTVDQAHDPVLNPATYSQRLRALLNIIDYELSAYDVTARRNQAVTRKGDILTLPLYVTEPFANVTKELAGYIEPLWTSDRLKLKIDWKFELSDLVFKVLLGEGQGARSMVSRRRKEIVFYSDLRERTFPHEIGHVLGFPDRYFSIWHEESCEYEDQTNEQDLMSDSSLGSVTAESWEELLQAYPKATVTVY